MQKQSTRLIILLICFALLIMPSAAGVAQSPPVAILLLDQFTTRRIGLDPDPFIADEYLNTLLGIIQENSATIVESTGETLLYSLQNLPQDGVGELITLTEGARQSYAQSISTRISAEQGSSTVLEENCVGYLPGLRSDSSVLAGAGLYYVNGAGGTSGQAHGLIVSHAIVDAVASSVVDNNGDGVPDIRIAWGPPDDEYEIELDELSESILVKQADTSNFLLSAITQQIQNLDSQFQWVINASFVVVPCQALPELATLEGIIRALQKYDEDDPAIDLFGALGDAINRFTDQNVVATNMVRSVCVLNNEPEPYELPSGTQVNTTSGDCQNFEETLSGAGTFVAAAGNAGLPYPFYPASAPHAIAVSATAQDMPYFAAGIRSCPATSSPGLGRLCSNAGEVLMPGLTQPNGKPYYGTSFAAPRLSLRLAVFLAHHDGDACGLSAITEGMVDVLLNDLPTLLDGAGNPICDPLQQTRNQVFQD